MSIEGSAINAIADLAEKAFAVERVEIGGRTYTDKEIFLVQTPKVPEPAMLTVSTLTGLVDFIRANKDALDLGEYVVHVVSPVRVDLLSKAKGEHLQRFRWISAQALDRFAAVSFSFGTYLSQETMSIALMALFEDAGDRAAVLKVVGGVVAEEGVTQKDDGMKQQVVMKQGVAVVASGTVPNPVTLA